MLNTSILDKRYHKFFQALREHDVEWARNCLGNLDRLDIILLNLDANEIKTLCLTLQAPTKLKYLSLSYGSLMNSSGVELAAILESNPQLTHLNLEYNKLNGDYEDDAILKVAEILENSCDLTFLSLKGNRIGNKGVMAVVEALKKHTTLFYLNLSHNLIGDKGARVLAELLEFSTCLSRVDLSWNFISDKGVKLIMKTLRTKLSKPNSNPIVVQLYHNRDISDEIAKEIYKDFYDLIKLTSTD